MPFSRCRLLDSLRFQIGSACSRGYDKPLRHEPSAGDTSSASDAPRPAARAQPPRRNTKLRGNYEVIRERSESNSQTGVSSVWGRTLCVWLRPKASSSEMTNCRQQARTAMLGRMSGVLYVTATLVRRCRYKWLNLLNWAEMERLLQRRSKKRLEQ
jgi:hypothetical protein